jgi:hypothetical protein
MHMVIQFPTSNFLKVNNSNIIRTQLHWTMWKWLYNGYAAMCIDDCMFVFHMDFSFHCSNSSTQRQHVSRTQALVDSWWPLFPHHNRCCPNNKESGVEFYQFTITYVSHIAIVTCLFFQVVWLHSNIYRCLDITKQKENYENK